MKGVFVLLGILFFGLAALGAFLPILPTVPFLLLASGCFARGSERFDRWFKASSLYKNHMEKFVKSRSMSLKTKIGLLAFSTPFLLLGMVTAPPLPLKLFLGALLLFHYYYFLVKIKTIPVENRAKSLHNDPAEKKTKIR